MGEPSVTFTDITRPETLAASTEWNSLTVVPGSSRVTSTVSSITGFVDTEISWTLSAVFTAAGLLALHPDTTIISDINVVTVTTFASIGTPTHPIHCFSARSITVLFLICEMHHLGWHRDVTTEGRSYRKGFT
jgi:hypothetical protein